MFMNTLDKWLKNGYALKLFGIFCLTTNWIATLSADFYRIVIQCVMPEPLLIAWTVVSFSPVLIIFGWHITLIPTQNGGTIPILEESNKNV